MRKEERENVRGGLDRMFVAYIFRSSDVAFFFNHSLLFSLQKLALKELPSNRSPDAPQNSLRRVCTVRRPRRNRPMELPLPQHAQPRYIRIVFW